MEARTLNEIARAMQDADGVHECGRENTHTQGWYRNLATAAIAVVQPELDRLRAENVELSHREKVRSEAINRALTCQRELAEEARSVADLANKLFDQREEYLSGLNARNAELSAENARLRSALEPFASRAGRYDPVDNDDGEPDWSTAAPSIRIGDLRRARSELESGHE